MTGAHAVGRMGWDQSKEVQEEGKGSSQQRRQHGNAILELAQG